VELKPAQQKPAKAWVDSILGTGSTRTLRMRAVDPGVDAQAAEPVPKAAKPKGYVRLVLAGAVLAVVAAKTRPWNSLGALGLPAKFQAKAAAEPKEKEAPAAPEAKLPLLDAGGKAVALWRSGSGAWFGVNAKGYLSRMTDAEAAAALSLPKVEGAALESEEKRSGKLLRLAVDPQQWGELLPLPDSLAAECAMLTLHGREFRLRTHSGMSAELGEGAFQEKLAKLSLVLADLQARKRRAASVDLRFDNTAVVRLAAR
jgi:hypothetical protein